MDLLLARAAVYASEGVTCRSQAVLQAAAFCIAARKCKHLAQALKRKALTPVIIIYDIEAYNMRTCHQGDTPSSMQVGANR